MEAPKTPEEAQERLFKIIVVECKRRRALYDMITPRLAKNPEDREQRTRNLIQQLHHWSRDPLAFIEDIGWAPDPVGSFGSRAIPPGMAPKGMVPLIPFNAQKELIREFPRMLEEPRRLDLAAVKSRQVAFTTIFMWLALWAWLFRGSTTGILGSYKDEFIDTGGKGQREADSLFGRLRMFLDAFFTCLPHVKFNQHLGKTKRWRESPSGLTDAQDISFKLTRPAWAIYQKADKKWVFMFPDAEGNWLKGALPSDNFGRSLSATFAMMDEIGQYGELGEGKDRDAWNATANNVKCRFAWGTIPKRGGPGSKFYELMEGDDATTLTRLWVHWSDIIPYMAGAKWKCHACGEKNDHPVHPGPGRQGKSMVCGGCDRMQKVTYRDMWSPWFEEQAERLQWDKIAIAREFQMDWMAAQGDVFFNTIERNGFRQIVNPKPSWIAIDGIDPGYSVDNPAAWMCGMLDPRNQKIYVVGYWMAANAMAEYFVPFLKRWSSHQAKRMQITYGHKYQGMTFGRAFDYSDDAYAMMDHLARLKVPLGTVYGDKFGSHRMMTESPYEILTNYGIYVDQEYTKDREALCRRGQLWATNMKIDDRIADIQPMSPLNKAYPSLEKVFLTAKPTPTAGQGAYKLDVDKKNPPHVNHAVDAWLYLCRAFAHQTIHSSADPSGGYSVDGFGFDEPIKITGWMRGE